MSEEAKKSRYNIAPGGAIIGGIIGYLNDNSLNGAFRGMLYGYLSMVAVTILFLIVAFIVLLIANRRSSTVSFKKSEKYTKPGLGFTETQAVKTHREARARRSGAVSSSDYQEWATEAMQDWDEKFKRMHS